MCAGCTVQEGKRIDGEDGEELLKIREAKHRNPRRMLKREKKKRKKCIVFFLKEEICLRSGEEGINQNIKL